MKKKIYYYFSFILAVVIKLVWCISHDKQKLFLAKVVVDIFHDEKILEIREEYDPEMEKVIVKVILALPSFGCSHYFNNGGCAMCGFNLEIEKYGFRYLHSQALIMVIDIFLFFLKRKIDNERIVIDVLSIFMAGSFLNDSEFPVAAQEKVIDFFRKSEILKLCIETRPEYVFEKNSNLMKYVRSVEGKKIEVAFGLESSDDRIRNIYIKKHLSKNMYIKSVSILRDLNVIVNTYILIGAPYLSRKEIVKKAIESILFAWQSGSHIISLETYCVQEGTSWGAIYAAGQLQMPNLWDIISIIEEVNKVSSKWCLGKFSDWPEPIATPRNCNKCTDKILVILDQLRLTHDIKLFNKLPECPCRNCK